MATLLYTIFGITAGASLHCAQRREISPCTCAPHETYANTIQVTCERMDNFTQVVHALENRLPSNFNIWLKITHSNLMDLENATFAEMNMNIKNLKLNHNNLTWVFFWEPVNNRIEEKVWKFVKVLFCLVKNKNLWVKVVKWSKN